MGNIIRNLDWSVLTGVLISVVPALICITFHELAHGYIAYRLGDTTAKDLGRLTLNPIKHIDIFGIIMMVLFQFGWAKPVPVNMTNFKKPKRDMAITAFAGPISNLILAVFILFIYGLLYARLGGGYIPGIGAIVLRTLNHTAVLSVSLAVFNLLPIPPLDGSKVLFSILPEKLYFNLMRVERFGMIFLLAFVRTRIFQDTLGRMVLSLFSFFTGAAQFAYNLVN
jgi:Zn-dependent protease